jgi:hypothetical protein
MRTRGFRHAIFEQLEGRTDGQTTTAPSAIALQDADTLKIDI